MEQEARIDAVTATAFRIPTASPESDGTLEWESTTLVVCEISARGATGLGYTYGPVSVAPLITGKLNETLAGADALAVRARWRDMVAAIRNMGRPGIASMAIAACDVALHDLSAKLLDVPMIRLLGKRRERIPIYGSGGFTSYGLDQLAAQVRGWADEGLAAVKIKIGREPSTDLERIAAAREAIGREVDLFVDANGAYDRKQALALAERMAEYDVSWFEEPVSSDDLEGLRLLRDRAPGGMEITAGEYGYDTVYFRRMLAAGAVDVLQADATRCAGITGFLLADAVAFGFAVPLSSHTAPALHLHPCAAAHSVRHMEWFFDHARVERMLFEGAPEPHGGGIAPDLSRPGHGLSFRRRDAEQHRVWPAGPAS